MTQRTTNLARRLQRRIWWLGVFIAGLSSLIVFAGSRRQEDSLFRMQARLALDAYLERHPEILDGAPLAPLDSPWFSVYRGEDGLPPEYRAQARELPPGPHDLTRQASGPEEHVLVIREVRQGWPRLYLLFDVRDFNKSDELLYSGWLVFLAVGGVAALLALLFATSSTRRFFAPVSSLVETIETTSEPGHFATTFDRAGGERHGDPEEVRELRGNLRASMARIDRLVQREREFSRNASHELRTPLTVIRSGAELLGRELDSPTALRRVRNIERAASEMEQVIDMFLCLAREELPPESDHPVDLEHVARSVVDANIHLLGSREVEVRVQCSRPVVLRASDQILSILLSNLVRNAFTSTQTGSVTIEADADRVRVLDTGEGVSLRTGEAAFSDKPTGRGFGLRIVEDLCKRLGWSFVLTERASGGAVAELQWPISTRFDGANDEQSQPT